MSVQAQFIDEDTGDNVGEMMQCPSNIGSEELNQILNHFLDEDEQVPHLFLINNTQIEKSIEETIKKLDLSTEQTIEITFRALSLFKVKPVTRCISTMDGHEKAILCCAFSPDNKVVATGSADLTIIIWDSITSTPIARLRGHTGSILCISFSPDGKKLASGGRDNSVRVWNTQDWTQVPRAMRRGNAKAETVITSISWQPFHQNPKCDRLIAGSSDGAAHVWDTTRGVVKHSLGHRKFVSTVIWGGQQCIYTASRDCTISLWDSSTFTRLAEIRDHAHWVNAMALSTGAVLRRGMFNERGRLLYTPEDGEDETKVREQTRRAAVLAYRKACGQGERICAGSDDFTITLIDAQSRKVISRSAGHSKAVNHVAFSPDGHHVVSASFDHSLRLWDGHTGKAIRTLSTAGHVQRVYLAAWSSDGKWIASASEDGTVKIWGLSESKPKHTLPGHGGPIYGLDWSPDGEHVVSGGVDKKVKIWAH